MFAKLFGPPDDQIVAMLKAGDDGLELRLFVKPKNTMLDVCETALQFHDGKEAEAKKAFEELDEAGARKLVGGLLESIAHFGNKDDDDDNEDGQ